MTLANIDFRSNAIGFLRLFFAAAVVWSHAYYLGGFGEDPIARTTHGALTAGLLSVGGFFVLSGFLITRSFERVDGIGRFLWHRVLRIFPAFWVCLFLVAFVVAPLLYAGQHGTFSGFFSQMQSPGAYVVKNALLKINQLSVAGPFPSLPFPRGINGSLWTLEYEFLCYLGIAGFGVAGTLRRKPELLIAACLTFLVVSAAFSAVRGMHPTPYGAQVLYLYVFFAIGACAYLFRSSIPMRWELAALSVVALVAALPTRAYGLVTPISISYITFFAAMKFPIRSFDRRADLSYGVYIYAFPIQQLLAMYHFNGLGLLPYFAAALALVCPLAALSWFFIERPSLALKNYSFAVRTADV